MHMQSDSDLVRLSREGQKAAFGVLIECYLPLIMPLTNRMVNDADLAHDLAQDALLEAFLSQEYLRDPGRFRSCCTTSP
jgi:DNA-directed RNA polymerase specialized sigma24 family protein